MFNLLQMRIICNKKFHFFHLIYFDADQIVWLNICLYKKAIDLDHILAPNNHYYVSVDYLRRFIMLWHMFSDPVVWGSLLGIFIMVGMMVYYTYLFMHNSGEDDK